MLDLIYSLVMISVLVFIHELGHFWVAIRNGIAVDEFGMGLPPRVWGRKIKGVFFSLNLLPIGGFVRLRGEDDDTGKFEKDPHSFSAKSPFIRCRVLLAGVVANFILGLLLLTLVFRLGVAEPSLRPVIAEIEEGSPAQVAGLQKEDEVVAVNGQAVSESQEVTQILSSLPSSDLVTLLIMRNGVELPVPLTLREGKMGVMLSSYRMVTYSLREAPIKGIQSAVVMTGMMLDGLGELVKTLLTQGRLVDDVAGPVGIVKMTGEARQLGLPFITQFAGVLSLNLGLINVLPFPALDGGRLIFVLWEMVTRRKPSAKLERYVHAAGMLLLLALLLLVTLQDLSRFVG